MKIMLANCVGEGMWKGWGKTAQQAELKTLRQTVTITE